MYVYGDVPPLIDGAVAVYAVPVPASGSWVAATVRVGLGTPRRVGPPPLNDAVAANSPPRRVPAVLDTATAARGT